jgi:hypothetical protein
MEIWRLFFLGFGGGKFEFWVFLGIGKLEEKNRRVIKLRISLAKNLFTIK